MASKVFFTDFRSFNHEPQTAKLIRLIKAAGIDKIDFQDKYVAVKIHFGEPGNMAFLRPQYAKAVCDYIKSLGGRPFVTDCNTLYVGERKDGLRHLTSAFENGYNPFCTGVHTIIADGIKGLDEALVPVRNGEYVKEAKIGSAIMDADIVISISHFKGHECAGFGGALKNLGMGSGSRAGKMEMHSASKPRVITEMCVGCGRCAKECAHGGPVIENGKCHIDNDKCVGCGRCIGACLKDAIVAAHDEKFEVLNYKIAEYAMAVCDGRPNFHISIARDISPLCDCHGDNDIPIVDDIGMFASFDPVAIDVACADAVNALPPKQGSILEENGCSHHDHFTDVAPETNWRAAVIHGEKIGLGVQDYELVRIK